MKATSGSGLPVGDLDVNGDWVLSRMAEAKGAGAPRPDRGRDVTAVPPAESLRKVGAFL